MKKDQHLCWSGVGISEFYRFRSPLLFDRPVITWSDFSIRKSSD